MQYPCLSHQLLVNKLIQNIHRTSTHIHKQKHTGAGEGMRSVGTLSSHLPIPRRSATGTAESGGGAWTSSPDQSLRRGRYRDLRFEVSGSLFGRHKWWEGMPCSLQNMPRYAASDEWTPFLALYPSKWKYRHKFGSGHPRDVGISSILRRGGKENGEEFEGPAWQGGRRKRKEFTLYQNQTSASTSPRVRYSRWGTHPSTFTP